MLLADLIRRFLPYVLAIKRMAVLNLVLVLVSPLIGAGLLWSFKMLFDEVLVAGRSDLLATFAVTYAIAASAKIAVDYAAQYVEANAIEAIVLALRSDLYNHVLSLSPGSLGNTTSGDVLTRLQGDTIRTETLIYTAPVLAFSDAAATLIYLGLLTYLNWQLTLCTLAALPVIVVLVNRISPLVRRASQLSRRADSHWMSLAEERLSAVPVVHAFSAEAREAQSFWQRCAKVRRMEVKSLVLQARQSALVELVVAVAGLAVVGMGALLIRSGLMTIGELVTFIGTVGSLYTPIRSLAKAAGRFQNSAAGAQRVAELLDRPSLVADKPFAHALQKVRGAIAFQDVHFSYPNGQKVLHGVSFKIEPGETVALVGPSGSGKTSLARLLLRHSDPASGVVRLDGLDVREIALTSLRHAIAPVFQDAMILNGTIEKNIRYGAPGVPRAEVTIAAQAAAVDRFAFAKGGLLAPVGPGGARLSGGQRQRVALARALLCKAPVLLLDEATAGLDSETEELIQEALIKLARQRTILVVAHRLSSVCRADRVIVLEDGRIVETGKPTELLAAKSRCRELFSAQLVERVAA